MSSLEDWPAVREGDTERAKGCFQSAVQKYEQAARDFWKRQSSKLTNYDDLARLYRKMACLLALQAKNVDEKDCLPAIDWSKADDMNSKWMNEFVPNLSRDTSVAIQAGDVFYNMKKFMNAYMEYSRAVDVARKAIGKQDKTEIASDTRKSPPTAPQKKQPQQQQQQQRRADARGRFDVKPTPTMNYLEGWKALREADAERSKGCWQSVVQKYQKIATNLLGQRQLIDSVSLYHKLALLHRKIAFLSALLAAGTDAKELPETDWSKVDEMNSTWMDDFAVYLCRDTCSAIKVGDELYNSKDFMNAYSKYVCALSVAQTRIDKRGKDKVASAAKEQQQKADGHDSKLEDLLAHVRQLATRVDELTEHREKPEATPAAMPSSDKGDDTKTTKLAGVPNAIHNPFAEMMQTQLQAQQRADARIAELTDQLDVLQKQVHDLLQNKLDSHPSENEEVATSEPPASKKQRVTTAAAVSQQNTRFSWLMFRSQHPSSTTNKNDGVTQDLLPST